MRLLQMLWPLPKEAVLWCVVWFLLLSSLNMGHRLLYALEAENAATFFCAGPGLGRPWTRTVKRETLEDLGGAEGTGTLLAPVEAAAAGGRQAPFGALRRLPC